MAELSAADRALLTEVTERARARMTGRTIDETGKDVNERQPEPEQIRTGWYWTGNHAVWVVGPTPNGRGIYYHTPSSADWLPMRNTAHWQRVHERVQESGKGFAWRPSAPND